VKMPEPYDSTGIEFYNIPSFKFVSGVTKPIKIAYRSFNPSGSKTALIPTCYAGYINETLNFTSGALKDYHVIVVAMLGNGESSAPSNNPDFPADYSLRYQDCINSQYQLVTEHLGIKSLDAVIGFSMGGQQAYYWAVMHGSGPEPFVKNVVPICGSAKTSGHSESILKCQMKVDLPFSIVDSGDLTKIPLDYAFLEGPIAALTTSYDYHGGKYKEQGVKATEGMRAFGRAYCAWLTSVIIRFPTLDTHNSDLTQCLFSLRSFT
jgi:pimeloyl-ACP methyl ester carboxylesterase